MKSVCKDPLLKLISECGQIAEIKSSKMQQHGIDETELLVSLSEDDRTVLTEMLQCLKKQWMEDHKQRHLKNKQQEQNK
ncbi:hypothetical protein [Candidatus Epulonipiscium viviparus]|uniref:hypothetical protein n=1 Tax=Candidatus Epulonipiscium viviparus TaxID=420336 RepID=UPI0027380BDA|nr:hypothetical protein [Candidatus Epulopiscium viviparus]